MSVPTTSCTLTSFGHSAGRQKLRQKLMPKFQVCLSMEQPFSNCHYQCHHDPGMSFWACCFSLTNCSCTRMLGKVHNVSPGNNICLAAHLQREQARNLMNKLAKGRVNKPCQTVMLSAAQCMPIFLFCAAYPDATPAGNRHHINGSWNPFSTGASKSKMSHEYFQ